VLICEPNPDTEAGSATGIGSASIPSYLDTASIVLIDCNFSPGPRIAANSRLRGEDNFFLWDQLSGTLLGYNLSVLRSVVRHCESDTGGPTVSQVVSHVGIAMTHGSLCRCWSSIVI
jgi:hypothetical protein